MEMELSLMYDILYTKAAVIHTLVGYCIRFITIVATAAVFLLFQFSGGDGYSRVDVVITYILVGGAFLLELRSLLAAVLSSWTLAFLCGTRWRWLQHAVLCSGRWNRLRHVAASLHRFIGIVGLGSYSRSARRWSGTMGQYNMLHLCTRPSKRKRSNSASGSLSSWDCPLLGRLAKMLGREEWWDRKHHSRTIKISEDLKKKLLRYIERLPGEGKMSTQGVFRKKWGKELLESCNLKDRLKIYLGIEFQEGIIIWHMATEVFLAQHTQVKAKLTDDEALIVEAVRALSNYMMFLLVEHPYMLPGLSQSRLYRRTCENLMEIWCQEAPSSNPSASDVLRNLFRLRDDPNSRSSLREIEKLAVILYEKRDELEATPEVPRLVYATDVATILLENDEDDNRVRDSLLVLLFVWRDFLVHAANRCSRESHAKKLGSGGELTTILWLFGEHSQQSELFSRARAEATKHGSQQA
uniref:Uncharacterized protein n=1 Tax=Avena sativa TaxID=4498 RepID=A0ACD5XYV2_AVESA